MKAPVRTQKHNCEQAAMFGDGLPEDDTQEGLVEDALVAAAAVAGGSVVQDLLQLQRELAQTLRDCVAVPLHYLVGQLVGGA